MGVRFGTVGHGRGCRADGGARSRSEGVVACGVGVCDTILRKAPHALHGKEDDTPYITKGTTLHQYCIMPQKPPCTKKTAARWEGTRAANQVSAARK